MIVSGVCGCYPPYAIKLQKEREGSVITLCAPQLDVRIWTQDRQSWSPHPIYAPRIESGRPKPPVGGMATVSGRHTQRGPGVRQEEEGFELQLKAGVSTTVQHVKDEVRSRKRNHLRLGQNRGILPASPMGVLTSPDRTKRNVEIGIAKVDPAGWVIVALKGSDGLFHGVAAQLGQRARLRTAPV